MAARSSASPPLRGSPSLSTSSPVAAAASSSEGGDAAMGCGEVGVGGSGEAELESSPAAPVESGDSDDA